MEATLQLRRDDAVEDMAGSSATATASADPVVELLAVIRRQVQKIQQQNVKLEQQNATIQQQNAEIQRQNERLQRQMRAIFRLVEYPFYMPKDCATNMTVARGRRQ